MSATFQTGIINWPCQLLFILPALEIINLFGFYTYTRSNVNEESNDEVGNGYFHFVLLSVYETEPTVKYCEQDVLQSSISLDLRVFCFWFLEELISHADKRDQPWPSGSISYKSRCGPYLFWIPRHTHKHKLNSPARNALMLAPFSPSKKPCV